MKPSKRHGKFILAGKSYQWILDSENRIRIQSNADEWTWFTRWQRTAADLYYSANGVRHDQPRLPGQWTINREDHPFSGMTYEQILDTLIRVAQIPDPWAHMPAVITRQAHLYAESLYEGKWLDRLDPPILAGDAEDRSSWRGFVTALSRSGGMTVTGRLPKGWKLPMQ